MKRRSFAPLLLVLTALATGCQMAVSEPETHPDASGVLVEVLDAPVAPNTVTRVLVEHPGAPAPIDRSIVHVSTRTTILVRASGGRPRAGGVDDLRPGAFAHIRILDLELRSYPRQVFATRIEVVR